MLHLVTVFLVKVQVQLENLVKTVLPPSSYAFQVTLPNQKRADCVLKLPNPPGDIVIDSRFFIVDY